jgi:hypothetical protein
MNVGNHDRVYEAVSSSHAMTLKQSRPRVAGIDVLRGGLNADIIFRRRSTGDRIRGVFNRDLGFPFCSSGCEGRNIL